MTKSVVSALVFSFFVCSALFPAPALGEDQIPEKRPCHINASAEWSIDEDGKIREGSLNLTANGTLKLSEQMRKPVSRMQGNLRYEVEHLTLYYSYNEQIKEKEPSTCQENPVLEQWSAGGSYQFGGGDPSGAGLYIRNVGTMSPPASIVKGVGAEQFLAMLQAQAPQVVTNYYEFFGFGAPPEGVKKGIKLTGRIRKSDCTFRDSSKNLNPVVSIRMRIPEDGSLQGKEAWKAKYTGGMSLSKIGVSDLPATMETEPFKPAKAPVGGDITYRLSWSFEEITPEIRIYQVSTDGEGKLKDITGEEVEVFIGEKVTLAAKALGLVDDSVEDPTWRIDGRFIEDYKVIIQGEDTRTELDKEVNLKKDEVTFVWIRGDFSGKPMQVQVTGMVGEKKTTGKTTFKVFAPRLVNQRVRCSPHVSLGERFVTEGRVPRMSLDGVSCAELDAAPEEYFDNLNRHCSVYAGQVESLCDPAKIERGIVVEHAVEVPWIPKKAYALQYVQLITEDSQTTNYDNTTKSKKNDPWCIDTSYPYSSRTFTFPTTSAEEAGDPASDGRAGCSGPRCRIRMEDTPELPVEQGSLIVLHEGSITHDFETFLMFRPANRESDKETVWVPLAKVSWGWSAKVERQKDPNTGEYLDWRLNLPCREAYSVLSQSSPSDSGCRHSTNPEFPEWDCNVKKNDQ